MSSAVMSSPAPLAGQVALVTGASRGIGRAIALELAAAGAQVVVNYASSPDAAEAVVAEITAAGGEAWSHRADVADEEQVDAMVKANSSDPAKYLPVLAKTSGFKGVTGDIGFDEKGDIKNGALTLHSFKGGKKINIAVVR